MLESDQDPLTSFKILLRIPPAWFRTRNRLQHTVLWHDLSHSRRWAAGKVVNNVAMLVEIQSFQFHLKQLGSTQEMQWKSERIYKFFGRDPPIFVCESLPPNGNGTGYIYVYIYICFLLIALVSLPYHNNKLRWKSTWRVLDWTPIWHPIPGTGKRPPQHVHLRETCLLPIAPVKDSLLGF